MSKLSKSYYDNYCVYICLALNCFDASQFSRKTISFTFYFSSQELVNQKRRDKLLIANNRL